MDTFLEVLKWIGIAFAAGFVGYFGRIPAKALIAKIRGKKESVSTVDASSEADKGRTDFEKSRLKIEKKHAKQAAKMAKKSAKQ